MNRSVMTPVTGSHTRSSWSSFSGAVSAPCAEPDAGNHHAASVLTVPVTSYPSSPESQGA